MNPSTSPHLRGLRLISLLLLAASGLLAGGCNSTPDPKYVPEFFMEAPAGAGTEVTMPMTGLKYRCLPQPVVTGDKITGVDLLQDQVTKEYGLRFDLSDAGRSELYGQTAANQGRKLFLFLNGKPIGVHPIDGPVESGQIEFFIEVPEDKLLGPDFMNDLKESIKDIQELSKPRMIQ